jgi:type VI secretion system protein ImpM
MELSMPDDAVTAWLFGKLPTHGDFVFRGLSMEQRDRLDLWLSSEMESAQQRLGASFNDHYDNAPPWCFSACDEAGQWDGGALCPSMDSAGRRFPIVIARKRLAKGQAMGVAQNCVELIYRAFEESMTADALHLAVSELISDDQNQDGGDGWWVEDEDHNPVIKLEGKRPRGLIATMLEGAPQ